MNETLQLVEDVVASRTPPSVPQPLRNELLPRLDRATTLDDAEQVIHDAGHTLEWLGDALLADPAVEELVHQAIERALPRMLALQEELERTVGSTVGALAAREAIVAHETLRRLFALGIVERHVRDRVDASGLTVAVKPRPNT